MLKLEDAIKLYCEGNKRIKFNDFTVERCEEYSVGDIVANDYGVFYEITEVREIREYGKVYFYNGLGPNLDNPIMNIYSICGKVTAYNGTFDPSSSTRKYETVVVVRHSVGGKQYYFYNPSGKYLNAGSVVLCQTSKGEQVGTVELCLKVHTQDIGIFKKKYTDGRKLNPIIGVFKLAEQYGD